VHRPGKRTRRRQLRETEDGRREVEGRGQVAAQRAPPLRNIRLDDTGQYFEEANDRCVVEYLRAYVTAPAPRRNHEHRHARAQTDRQAADKLIRRPRRWHGRRDMIEEAIVFIVVDQQHRGRPDVGIGSQRGQHAGDEIGAVLGRIARMFAAFLRLESDAVR